MVALNEQLQHCGVPASEGTPSPHVIDGLGNWRATGFTPVGGSQTTDQRNHNYVNEITQRTVGTGSQVVFQYDGKSGASNGNLANDGTLIYSYDALNRPIQIINEGLVIATYLYDAMNRRMRKTVNNGGMPVNIPNGTTDYIWQGGQVMEERNPFGGSGSTDTPIKQYIWGTYIDECIQLTTLVTLGAQNLAAGTYYLLQDLLYRAVALTNFTGTIVEAYDCDAYGNTIIFTGPGTDGVWFTNDDVQSTYGANEIIYCGYRYDPETELYHVRARTYSPSLGRWIQRDPIGYRGGINLYEYVAGRVEIGLDSKGTNPGNKQCCGVKSNCCGPDVTAKLIALAGVINHTWNALSAGKKIKLASETVFPPTATQAWDTSLVGTGIDAMPCQNGTGKCKNTVTVGGKCYWQPAVNYWLAGLIFTIFNNIDFEWAAQTFNTLVILQTFVAKPLDHPIWKINWYDAGMTSIPSNVPEPNIYSSCKPCKTKAATLTWQWGFLSGSI